MARSRMAASALSSYMAPGERNSRSRADSLKVTSQVRSFGSEDKILREVMWHGRVGLRRGRAVQQRLELLTVWNSGMSLTPYEHAILSGDRDQVMFASFWFAVVVRRAKMQVFPSSAMHSRFDQETFIQRRKLSDSLFELKKLLLF